MPIQGETIVSPITGFRAKFVTLPDEGSTEPLRIEFTVEKDCLGPPMHYHIGQRESYEVLEGKLGLCVDGREFEIGPGETAEVPEGAKHKFWNAHEGATRFYSDHTPALGFAEFLKALYHMEADGLCGKDGLPNFVRFCSLMNEHFGEQYIAGPPKFVQNLLNIVLSGLGRLLGYRRRYRSRQVAGAERAVG